MRVVIEFETNSDAFVGNDDWERGHVDCFYDAVGEVLMQARGKVVEQRMRPFRSSDCICTHHEEADVLRDPNGNRIGTVKVLP